MVFDLAKKIVKKTGEFAEKFLNMVDKKIDFHKRLRNFKDSLNSLSRSINSFKGLIGNKFDGLESFYDKLVRDYPMKYSIEINKYKSLFGQIPSHDTLVRKVDTIINEFSYDEIISQPLDYSSSSFSKYDEAVSILSKYQSWDRAEKYNTFLDQLNEIKGNIDFIKWQYKIAVEHGELIASYDGTFYKDTETRQALASLFKDVANTIESYGKYYYIFEGLDDPDALIKENNEIYFKNHANDTLFDSINGQCLDYEQRVSILSDEKASLTIAGAGSGKTLTICGKIEYLLERYGVDPENILVLSYSKKSADDLTNKLSRINKDLTVGTFHKLGLDILKEANCTVPTVEEQYDAIIEQYFRDEIKNKPKIMNKVLRFFALYLSPNRKSKKYENKGELYLELKKKCTDFKTLKQLFLESTNNIDKMETIKREHVKSFEEMALANFYFINGIDYAYEEPYHFKTSSKERRQYTPDFYLKKYGIYHEHYGLGRDGIPHQFEDEEAKKYLESIEWKRQKHAENKTACVETFSYEFDDGTIFKKLENELKSRGVAFKKMSPDEIWEALNSIYHGQNFKSFIKLVKSFLSLYKARYTDPLHFEEIRKSNFCSIYEKDRTNLFVDIVMDVYDYYISYLSKENKIDFDDMILKSMGALDEIDSFKYEYIIVDEFQDISYSRMLFLKKLISRGDSNLYAVGDDWQAIYRFVGCDLHIFLNFQKYFGFSTFNYIRTTYRNSQELQKIAGSFIMSNPEQKKKNIRSSKHLDKPIKVAYYQSDKFKALTQIFSKIYRTNKDANILILGRNNFDIDDYLNKGFYFDKKNKNENLKKMTCKKYPSFSISYSTVHGSKGLEEDFVVILNADDSRLGFPNKIEDDELLNLVLSAKSSFEYAEERRLWYVALTRTKSYVYIIADKDYPSSFLKEIVDYCDVIYVEEADNNSPHIACPDCKAGQLIKRTSGNGKLEFYGCSNYPYCRYQNRNIKAVELNKRCPKCGDFLTVRKSGNSNYEFLGCTNFPNCRYQEPLGNDLMRLRYKKTNRFPSNQECRLNTIVVNKVLQNHQQATDEDTERASSINIEEFKTTEIESSSIQPDVDPTEQYDEVEINSSDIVVGRRVHHEKWGEGEIVEIRNDGKILLVKFGQEEKTKAFPNPQAFLHRHLFIKK